MERLSKNIADPTGFRGICNCDSSIGEGVSVGVTVFSVCVSAGDGGDAVGLIN